MRCWPDWLWISSLAFILRWLGIAREQLWFDEAFTAWSVRPGTDFWGAVIGDNHPPLWNLIQTINVRVLGMSEFTLRLPACLFGVGAVLLIWAIARDLFGKRAARLAGLLAALLPAGVYFSQDARMYSAFAFFVLLTVWSAQRRNDILFVLAGLGAVYSHNVGVIYIFSIGLAMTLTRASWRGLIAPGLVALGWLPWASVVMAQVGNVMAGYWVAPLTLGGILYPGLMTTVGWRMAEGVQLPVYGTVIGLSILAVIRTWRRYQFPATWSFMAMVAIAPLMLAAFSLVVTNVWVYRALLPSGLGLCIVWAYLLSHLRGEARQYVQAAAAFAIGIALLSHYLPMRARPDVMAWAAPIEEGWRAGDLIYYLNHTDAIGHGVYVNRPYAIRPNPQSLLTITAMCREAMHLIETPLEQVNARRLWVTFNKTPYTTQDEINFLTAVKAAHSYQLVQEIGDSQLYLIEMESMAK